MDIRLHDKNHFLIGCNDKELLEVMQAMMDGSKVRLKLQIIIPLKSGPKIYKFIKYGINWIGNSEEIVKKLSANITKREANIAKIKSQYGKKVAFDYKCRGKYAPMEHQKIIFNMINYTDAAAILADPGTCKTGPYLWAIDEKIKRNQVKKALVITLSTLKKNVLEELSIQAPHLKGIVLGEKKQANQILNKGYKASKKNKDYDIYIANYESMFSLVELFNDEYFDMVVLDEAHRIGSNKSRQTKAMIAKFEFVKYKYIITGTLNANNLLSFYMPYRFLGPDTVPYAKHFEFRRTHMYTVDPDGHIWKPAPGSHEVVRKIIGKLAVHFSKDECLDLPPIIRQAYKCAMSGDQKKLYNQMKTDFIMEVDDMCGKCNKNGCCDRSCEDTLVAKNALVLSTKLRQIASGFYINTRVKITENGKEINDSNIITLNENPKLDLLTQVLNNIPQGKQVIIWTNYIPAVEMISERISKAFGEDSYLTCYKTQDAFEQIKIFRETGIPYIVANPSKMGVGHNIQFSCYQYFFSNSYSFIQREQAEGRQHRKGQEEKVTVGDIIVEGSIDELIIKALKNKQDLSISLSELARIL